MIGTLINAGSIAGAAAVGLLLRRGLAENVSETMQKGLGLLIAVIGIQYGLKAENIVLVGLALASGGLLGEWWRLEDRLTRLGQRLEQRMGRGEIAEGFVNASLLFCTGAMAILGSIQDGLTGNHQILLVKSMLDGVFSLLFAASMGLGVVFSALSVLLYQGAITLAAGVLKPLATPVLIADLNSWGGVLILGIALNLLGITRIRVANLLPGIITLPLLIWLSKLVGI